MSPMSQMTTWGLDYSEMMMTELLFYSSSVSCCSRLFVVLGNNCLFLLERIIANLLMRLFGY